ncbi:MAG: site-specific DNA-methyltransferase [Candidatus Omnitrophica bacterium]|nr:site-specific DNA-methyltransferase [Candidatus Omnitrophota bacterium]
MDKIWKDSFETDRFEIVCGDSLQKLKNIPSSSVSSICCDPPYGLGKQPDPIEVMKDWVEKGYHEITGKGFMGKEWDAFVPQPNLWKECLRVLKPGGHLLSFAGTCTQDWMAMSLRFAGFEIRDTVAWVYAQGFPKSMDVSKALDKAAGKERTEGARVWSGGERVGGIIKDDENEKTKQRIIYDVPATEEAKKWQGWGTGLKPALEPIILARKPFEGTVAQNVLEHGTGAINIEGCRVVTEDKLGGGHSSAGQQMNGGWKRPWMNNPESVAANVERSRQSVARSEKLGRWPANLIHDGSEEVLELFPDAKSGKSNGNAEIGKEGKNIPLRRGKLIPRNDSGSSARFFYCAKASVRERNEDLPKEGQKNIHPTVKPLTLMRYLCRLVTPENGTVLDPFMGSGTTGKAALLEGFDFIGIEKEDEYFQIAKARIENQTKGQE